MLHTQLADDADKYLPITKPTGENGQTKPLEEVKESPQRSQTSTV